MAIQILVHGKPLDPAQAVREALPLDTALICPVCEGGPVQASPPRTGIALPGELKQFVPRQQDRTCLRCGHRWMAVLPPAIVSHPHLHV